MTSPTRVQRALLALVAVATLASSACGDDPSVAAEASDEIEQLPSDLLPNEMLGLAVAREDMGERLANVEQAYTDAVGLYSFRKGELLQATLQITRFNDQADVENPRFRSSVINQIGGTVAQPISVGDDIVHVTSGTKQSLTVWWRGRHLLVLAVREDFLQPRALLRQALEIEP